MGDLHLGTSVYVPVKKMVDIQIFFHVPNPKADNFFPGVAEALAPNITAEEEQLIKSGDVIEIIRTKLYKLSDGVATIKESIQQLWQPVTDNRLAEIAKGYKFYGTTLSKAV